MGKAHFSVGRTELVLDELEFRQESDRLITFGRRSNRLYAADLDAPSRVERNRVATWSRLRSSAARREPSDLVPLLIDEDDCGFRLCVPAEEVIQQLRNTADA